MENVSVVIPTRNRPEKLRRCLTALADARELTPFEAHVCDSSDAASVREAVRKVCEEFEFVRYHRHRRKDRVGCTQLRCAGGHHRALGRRRR